MLKKNIGLFIFVSLLLASCGSKPPAATMVFEAASDSAVAQTEAVASPLASSEISQIASVQSAKAKLPISLPSNFRMPRDSNPGVPTTWKTFKDDSIIEKYLNRKPIKLTV